MSSLARSCALLTTVLLSLIYQETAGSFVYVDWTFETPQDMSIAYFLLEYSPPIGRPASGAQLPPSVFEQRVEASQPASVYEVAVTAQLSDGGRLLVLDKTLLSSPDAPSVLNVSTTATTATIYLRQSPSRLNQTLSIYVEYYPTGTVEQTEFIETWFSPVKLEGLQPNATYRYRAMSVFRGVPSESASNGSFHTALSLGFSPATTQRPSATTALSIPAFQIISSSVNEFYEAEIRISIDRSSVLQTLTVEYFPRHLENKRQFIRNIVADTFSLKKLSAATEYLIVIKQSGTSEVLQRLQIVTPPVVTSTLYPGEITSTSININISPTSTDFGTFDYYELTFLGAKNITRKFRRGKQKYSVTFTSLLPGKSYVFVLHTVYKGVESKPVVATVTTYPPKVEKLIAILQNYAVTLYWNFEKFSNETVTYRLRYSASDNSLSKISDIKSQKYIYTDLSKHVWYTFTVIAVINEAEGESESITVASGQAEFPPVIAQRLNSRQAKLTFDNQLFPDINGRIFGYAILIGQRKEDSLPAKSWHQVQNATKWPVFQATPVDWSPFANPYKYEQTTFKIGQKSCIGSKAYCNAFLRRGQQYFVKLRACTETNVCMESDYAEIAAKPHKANVLISGCSRVSAYSYFCLPLLCTWIMHSLLLF